MVVVLQEVFTKQKNGNNSNANDKNVHNVTLASCRGYPAACTLYIVGTFSTEISQT
jgi:hypothetical protein